MTRKLIDDELNTILAALRYWQQFGIENPETLPREIAELACPDPEHDDALTSAQVARLCEQLNLARAVVIEL